MKLVLDLETIALPRTTWEELTDRPCSTTTEEILERDKAYHQAQFQGAFCRIVCIGALAIPTNGPPQAMAWYGDDEATLLQKFWTSLSFYGVAPHSNPLFITHNGFGFDFPVLWQRSIIHQIKPTKMPSLVRYRQDPIYDTCEVWSQWDMRNRIKLDTLARVLGVPGKSGHGSEVAQQWLQGEHREVAEYCLQDLVVTYSCYCKMTMQPVPTPEILLATPTFIECPKPSTLPLL